MLAYIVRRLVILPIMLFFVIVVAFLMMHFAPGDPAAFIAGPSAERETVEAIRKELGIDLPLHQQFVIYFSRVIQGNLGRSYIKRTLVVDELRYAFTNTLYLVSFSVIWPIIIAIPLGIFASIHQNTIIDRLTTVFSVLGLSMPNFFLGLLFAWILAFKLELFPISGIGRPILSLNGLRYIILPSLTLGATNIGSMARLTRSNMLEVLRQDYVRTARAKGLREKTVIYKHALRNAALPIWTVLGLQLAYMLAGAVVVETIFAWPGLGRLLYMAITQRDFPTIQGSIMLMATMFILVNLFVDIVYTWFDPRVRFN